MNIRSSIESVNFGMLVQEQLARNPTACALRQGDDSWSRRELQAASHGLANRLAALDIAAGEPVVLELGASFEMVAGICAVLMAGGMAVPIDPDVSDRRRQSIVDDVSPRLILRTGPDGPRIDTCVASPRLAPDLAFLVYTSGTSGTPKGVEISHFSYARRLQHIVSAFPAKPDEVDLLWTPGGFIGMLDEVFFPLFQGVPSVIAPTEARRDPRAFAKLIAREKVTAFRVTPSLLDVIVTDQSAASLGSVRSIYCSGERLDDAILAKVNRLIPAQITSFYGASEAPGVAFHVPATEGASDSEPLYQPQAFARIGIMDDAGQPQTAGKPGEIWIGGIPLAEGYWNRPKLTAERFIEPAGQRWYRTGDLGVALPDGQFQVLGRLDQSEVNITGVRVNLADSCAALRTCPDIKAAWISAVVQPGRADPVLVGQCVLADGALLDARTLRTQLAPSLPNAAIPSSFMAIDLLPLTPNGKLDVRELADMAERHLTSRARPAISDASANSQTSFASLPIVLEEVEKLLSVSGLKCHEDFFQLGGTSLHAVQLALSLSERVGTELPAEIVFGTESLFDIARVVSQEGAVQTGPLRTLRVGDPVLPPLFTINATNKYVRLARELNTSGTVYNLNMFGLTNSLMDRLADLTLNDLAERLADAILAQHPAGPWRLMAYCQDGCLAIEIARVLKARTSCPCELYLIDTFFLDHKPSLKMSLMRMVDIGPGYYLRKSVRRMRHLMRRGRRGTIADADTVEKTASLVAKSRNDGRLYRKYIEFFTSYSPTFYDGTVHLFVSSEWKHVNLRQLHEMAGSQLAVHHFHGLHNAIFEAEGMAFLAPVIDEAFAAAGPELQEG